MIRAFPVLVASAAVVVAALIALACQCRLAQTQTLPMTLRSRFYIPDTMEVRRASDPPGPARKIRALVYMQFDTNEGYERYTVAINRLYCATHGHTFLLVDPSKYAEHPPWWRKVFLLCDLLQDASLDVDYVMWMDSDAAFIHPSPTLDAMLHPDPRFVVHVGMDLQVGEQQGDRWANAGVFLVRRCDAGLAFARAWAASFRPEMWCRRGSDLKDLTCAHHRHAWSSHLGGDGDHNLKGGWTTASRWSWDNFEQNMMTATMRRPEFVGVSCAYHPVYMSSYHPSEARYVLHMYAKSRRQRERAFRDIWAVASNVRAAMDRYVDE